MEEETMTKAEKYKMYKRSKQNFIQIADVGNRKR